MIAQLDIAHLTETFADFAGRHRGETIIVCGCGPSLKNFPAAPACITIGVNDVGRHFDPDYLVVVNPPSQFAPDRRRAITESRARAVFTQYADWRLQQAPRVPITLGSFGGVDFSNPNVLHYTRNSPYVAVCLAIHMGAARIGLIGVDLTNDHFFGATGVYPLAGSLNHIDAEYARLRDACAARGVEIVNLSPISRLTSLPRVSLDAFLSPSGGPTRPGNAHTKSPAAQVNEQRRLFCVHYRFLSCGAVFETGLREAADTLGLLSEHAYWDEPRLLAKVQRFKPDLLFVVHGRRFIQRWGSRFKSWRTAVWLLDEPYEVDDTSAWSGQFDHVFVNDAVSLGRHRNAYVLPVAYAPILHHESPNGDRRFRVGFVGGANPTRERLLAGLARRRLLDYVVGGPWREPSLRALCLSENIPAEETAALYRDTTIVINVFRDRHHYNRAALNGTAMNPRICEALACGALVLSEPRENLVRDVPELPVFGCEAEAAALIEHFLGDANARRQLLRTCAARLREATYSERLKVVMKVAVETSSQTASPAKAQPEPAQAVPRSPDELNRFNGDWNDVGGVARAGTEGEILIDPGPMRGSGVERGLVSRVRFAAIDLEFEAHLEAGACLIAKVHQQDAIDQTTNSYHVLAERRRAYLARHNHIFCMIDPPRDAWVRLRMACCNGVLSLWRDNCPLHRVRDSELSGGFAVISAQGGRVRLRSVKLSPAEPSLDQANEAYELKAAAATATPRLSIVTTVYDRIECLRRCIASVQRLTFQNYEHLIVADHPPAEMLERIRAIVATAGDERIGLFNLKQRYNNWGIAPAAAGLRRARGQYLSFLSDDNGYTPDHVEPLISVLDREPTLGFVYSSCQYDGRIVLRNPVPRPGRIDLGQPMFRRELLVLHFGNDLPFNVMGWDWHMVDALMSAGVRWRHIDRPTFLFRLAKYPHLIPT